MTDLDDMTRAINFAASVLRDELGPGGMTEDLSESGRQVWNEAIECLESVLEYPMIPMYFWRHPRTEEQSHDHLG